MIKDERDTAWPKTLAGTEQSGDHTGPSSYCDTIEGRRHENSGCLLPAW